MTGKDYFDSREPLGDGPGNSNPTPDLDDTFRDEGANVPYRRKKFRDVGPYKIMSKIGEGGMGSVYLAEQQHPIVRRVALKVIRPNLASPKTISRFEAERQALAMMDHPNIAKIIDAGTTEDGWPFFVMELVRGEPIHRYCDRHRLSIRKRLELFVAVCEAVQHAHQKGVLHRDIKPSNVLVIHNDGHPVVKVIDFGLAKAIDSNACLTGDSLHTEIGKFVGTVQYMSPEQAESGAIDVDTRTDVFSLGVLLYELLTGSIPLDKETVASMALADLLRWIQDVQPVRPSQKVSESSERLSKVSHRRQENPRHLREILNGELDWVVMKAIEKDRNRRYPSARSFADDVERFLNSDIVTARPPSRSYRLQKFVARNRAWAITTAAAAIMLVIATVLSSGFAWQANRSARQEHRLSELAKQKFSEAENERNAAKAALEDAEYSADQATEALNIFLTSFESDQRRGAESQPLTARQALDNALQATIQSSLEPFGKSGLLEVLASCYLALGDLVKAAEVNQMGSRLRQFVSDREGVFRSRMLTGRILSQQADYRQAIELFLQLQNELNEATLDQYEHAGDYLIGLTEELVDAYSLSGDGDTAISFLNEHIGDLSDSMGADHAEVHLARARLGTIFIRAGKHAKAVAILEDVIDRIEQIYGADHPRTNAVMNDLALAYTETGRFSAALQLQGQQLKRVEEIYGPEHPRTYVSQSNYSMTLQQLGRYQEAADITAEAYAKATRQLGPSHPNTLQIGQNHATSLYFLGRYEEALTMIQGSLAVAEKVLGPGHTDNLLMRANLGELLGKLGRHQEAAEELNSLLRTMKSEIGDNHPRTLLAENNLATNYVALGQNDKALSILERLVPRMLEHLGADHPYSSIAEQNLALMLLRNGEVEKAIPIQERRYAEALKKLGELHPTTLNLMTGLADGYDQIGQQEKAIELRLKVATGLAETLGEDHSEAINALERWVDALHRQNQFPQTEAALQKIIASRTETLGTSHDYTLFAMQRLSTVFSRTGRAEDGLKLRQKIFEAMHERHGQDHESTISAKTQLAIAQFETGKIDAAMRLIEENITVSEKSLGADHANTRLARQWKKYFREQKNEDSDNKNIKPN